MKLFILPEAFGDISSGRRAGDRSASHVLLTNGQSVAAPARFRRGYGLHPAHRRRGNHMPISVLASGKNPWQKLHFS